MSKTRKQKQERKRKRKAKGENGTTHGESAIVKPSLDEELKKLKAITRQIMKHEANEVQAKWFGMDDRKSYAGW